MKTFKKILSALLIGCMLFTLTACHGKNEVALTIEDETIFSALYLNALVDCDSEAKQRVDEEAAAETEETETETEEETDYYSKTLDGLSFVDYVKDKTLERCKEYVFYRKLVDEGTIKLTDEEINNAEYYAQLYWSNYGYIYLYEANGVSFDTYKEAFTYSYYSNAYFTYLYGEGGEKEVPNDDIKENMIENYALAHVLTSTYEEGATDDDKAALKTKLEGYEKRLKDGEEFEKIYLEHNGETEANHTHSETEDGPKLPHAVALTTEDATASFDFVTPSADFDAVWDMKVGDIQIIEAKDGSGISLYVKLDISSDEYYLNTLKDTILYELKEKEFQDYVTEKTKDYKVEENTFATNRFDVEDIDYSVLENAYAAANTTA